jgi:hypothetical protein
LKAQALRKIATPYSLTETLGVVWRNMTGLDHEKRGAPIQFLSRSHGLNPTVKTERSIAFVGDIMSVGKHRLAMDESVADFLSGCDYLVGNLEATVTQKRHRRGVLFGALQRQDAHVVNVLADLFPPTKTYLSLANNHTGDFEDQVYLKSCALLEERGFHLFGGSDRPHVDLNTRIRLHGGTLWSNQICKRIHRLGSLVQEALDEQGVNILFPHWGYELEKYPRPELVNMAKKFCLRFDAVLGHHPHTVQPVTTERVGNRKRLIAYSLGDFCTKIPNRAYRYGIIVRLSVGPGLSGGYRIGHIHWRFLECCRRRKRTLVVRVVDQVPYFQRRPDPKRLKV